jgi:2'-5' RNA ligase
MRLFVALEVAEPARREVRRRLAALRDRMPRARWTDPDQIHVTLAFLGEVDAAKLRELAERLAAAFAPFEPLDLRLDGGGTFPPGRPARVAWLGVDAPEEIAELQRAVEKVAIEVVGIEPEERAFRPHVTLARCPSPWRRETIEKYSHAFSGHVGPPFVARRGILFESKLSPSGARYRAVAELPFLGSDEGDQDIGEPTGEPPVDPETGS